MESSTKSIIPQERNGKQSVSVNVADNVSVNAYQGCLPGITEASPWGNGGVRSEGRSEGSTDTQVLILAEGSTIEAGAALAISSSPSSRSPYSLDTLSLIHISEPTRPY